MRLTLVRDATQWIGAAILAVAVVPFLNGSASRQVLALPDASAHSAARNVPRATPRVRGARQLAPAAARFLLAAAKRTDDASQADELFAPKSWYTPPPPPPPPPAPTPEAAPTAPPLPYTFLGSYTNADNETVYFLSRDDRVYDVKSGDTLDQAYSLSVEGSELVFTYKPLNVRQSVPLGGGP